MQARSSMLNSIEGRCSAARQLSSALRASLEEAERRLASARSSPYAQEEHVAAEAALRSAPVLDAMQLGKQELRAHERQLLHDLVRRANGTWKALRAAPAVQQAGQGTDRSAAQAGGPPPPPPREQQPPPPQQQQQQAQRPLPPKARAPCNDLHRVQEDYTMQRYLVGTWIG